MDDGSKKNAQFEEIGVEDIKRTIALYSLNDNVYAAINKDGMRSLRVELYEKTQAGDVMLGRLRSYEPNIEGRLHSLLSKNGVLKTPDMSVESPSAYYDHIVIVGKQLNDMLDIMCKHYNIPSGHSISILPGDHPKPILSYASEKDGPLETFALEEWSFDREKVIDPLIQKVKAWADFHSPKLQQRVNGLKHELENIKLAYVGVGLTSNQLSMKIHSVLKNHGVGESVLPEHVAGALDSGVSYDDLAEKLAEVSLIIWNKAEQLPSIDNSVQKQAMSHDPQSNTRKMGRY